MFLFLGNMHVSLSAKEAANIVDVSRIRSCCCCCYSRQDWILILRRIGSCC